MARKSLKSEVVKHSINEEHFSQENIHRVHHSPKHADFDYNVKKENIRVKKQRKVNKPRQNAQNNPDIKFNNHVDGEKPQPSINKSSGNIHFESNDILDDYKK